MVDVFRLVRDVLADDGTLWVNYGDTYASGGRGGNPTQATSGLQGGQASQRACMVKRAMPITKGLKHKDIVGMPWRIAFALQADGWYLRQDIVWHKPNPMPESVTDRCTKAHEYIFLLSKSPRYYFDQASILEPASPNTHARMAQDVEAQIGSARAHAGGKTNGTMKAVARGKSKAGHFGVKNNSSFAENVCLRVPDRNKRSVWTVATQPYSAAHFATFPPALIEPCILAGSRASDIVFDPFFGSGTTGKVAQRLGRQWIGCELNPAYEPLQRERVAQQGMVL